MICWKPNWKTSPIQTLSGPQNRCPKSACSATERVVDQDIISCWPPVFPNSIKQLRPAPFVIAAQGACQIALKHRPYSARMVANLRDLVSGLHGMLVAV